MGIADFTGCLQLQPSLCGVAFDRARSKIPFPAHPNGNIGSTKGTAESVPFVVSGQASNISRLKGKDLVWRQEKGRYDGRNVRQRQDLFRQLDAQHIDHKFTPLLATSIAIRESILQLLP